MKTLAILFAICLFSISGFGVTNYWEGDVSGYGHASELVSGA